jgi:hypothetical protein
MARARATLDQPGRIRSVEISLYRLKPVPMAEMDPGFRRRGKFL